MHEPHEMSYDAELLRELLDAAQPARDGTPLSAKYLAHKTGYATQTISDYRHGRINIPVRFWRMLFNLTRDLRILNLILGDSPSEIVFTDEIPDLAGQKVALEQCIQAVGDFHERHRHLAEILKDGRIDEADADGIRAYNDAYLRGRYNEALVCRAINRAYAQQQKERT